MIVLLMAVFLILPAGRAMAAKPIVIGAPLSTAFLYGWDAERGIKLAVDEINMKGGVNVQGEMRPFKVEVIDTRDLEPGVPVSDALLAVEKLILDKRANFIMGGPVRSEAALAAMSLWAISFDGLRPVNWSMWSAAQILSNTRVTVFPLQKLKRCCRTI